MPPPGYRFRLNGGPADGRQLQDQRIPKTIKMPEPDPAPGRPNPAIYRLKTDERQQPMTNAAGELLYAYDWRSDGWGISSAMRRELDQRAANPRPNSRGERR